MEERLCRVCLAQETSDKFTRIFENNLALKIYLISSIKIIESIEMPALICQQCERSAYQSFSFRQKIHTSWEYFERKLPPIQFIEMNDLEYLEDIKERKVDMEYEKLDSEETIEEYLEESDEIFEFSLNEELKNNLEKSIEQKSPDKRLSCQYCGLRLSRRQRLIQHERLHFLESAEKYTCDKCGKNFNQRFGLVPHFQKYHNFKPDKNKLFWKCAICINKILTPGKLEVHYQKNHTEFYSQNKVKLQNLQKMLPTKRKSTNVKLKNKTLRSEEKQKIFFPCGICGNSFTNSTRYQKHLNDLHGVREHEILQTDYSDSRNDNFFQNKDNIKKQKHIPCSTCGKMFANLNTCKTHEKIHSGLKYVCDLCGSIFSMKSYLTAHVQKVHMKLKRFKCNMCTKTFVHRELLNYHIKKHLNIRNYSCQFCQKTFVRKACVVIHERIHKNERPYSCKYCDRQFIHHSDYRRHENRHRNDISYRSFTTE